MEDTNAVQEPEAQELEQPKRTARERILKSDDRPLEPLGAIEEWSIEEGEVFLQVPPPEDFIEFTTKVAMTGGVISGQEAGPLVALMMVYEDGHRVFTSADAEELQKKNGPRMDKLAGKCLRMCGFVQEVIEQDAGN